MIDRVELCCGTGAVSLHALGGRPLAPYLGGKVRYAPQILRVVRELAGAADVGALHLVDAGEWPRTLNVAREMPEAVADRLLAWTPEDGRALFDRLRLVPPSIVPSERAATHLFLQARTYRGKPVSPHAAGWRTFGFDREDRVHHNPGPNTHVRGTVNTRPTLAARVRAFGALSWPQRTRIEQGDAAQVPPRAGAVVYIDPDYQGGTAYAYTLPRAAVFALASAWRAAGSAVVISERVPLDLPGARHVQLATPTNRTLGRVPEWLTILEAA
jgi:hypothetical protein